MTCTGGGGCSCSARSVFVPASLLAAASGTGAALIGARLLQGVGASMILPATLSTVTAVFHGPRSGRRLRHLGLDFIGGTAALGPLLGGWLATSYGWRWAFGVNLPLGALVAVGALLLRPRDPRPHGPDAASTVGGALLSAAGLAAVVFALIEGQRYGWLAALPGPSRPARCTWSARHLADPRRTGRRSRGAVRAPGRRAGPGGGRPSRRPGPDVFPVRLRPGNATTWLISVGELGLMFTLPLYLQDVHGDSPLQVGMAIMPLGLGTLLTRGSRPGCPGVSAPCDAPDRDGPEIVAVLLIGLTTRADTTGTTWRPGCWSTASAWD